MNPRIVFSILLGSFGLILAFLPSPGTARLTENPKTLLYQSIEKSAYFSVDQVARFVVSEDSTVLLVDLRNPIDFKQVSIPGSINIPYNQLLNKETNLESYFADNKKRVIFYSNGDLYSGYALVLARGLGFANSYSMKGGLNEWFSTVMNSAFTGDRISARENALFETRTRAKKYFTEINSLPDSLKLQFAQKSSFDPKKLDGGCE